jgi:hypothetical protein
MLQLTAFRFNTPTELKTAGRIDGKNGLLEVLGKIYLTVGEVKKRNEAIII